jgi:hypothetical protein
MTFIRGDRSIRTLTQNPTSTILREKGGFVTNNFTVNTGSTTSNQFLSIGNPYASAVDFNKLNKTGIGASYYLWDPKPGTYGVFATFITNGTTVTGCTNCGAGSSFENNNYFIQSGSGFFTTTTGAGATVTFVESSKVDGSNLTTRANSLPSSLRTTLYRVQNNTAYHFDEVLNIYGSDFSNNIDVNDASKLGNTSENLSLQRNAQNFAIESRNALLSSDTIFYSLGQLKLSNYRFEFSPFELQDPSLQAFLEDSYLNSRTPISLEDTTRVDFLVSADAGYYAPNRFRIVFRPLAPVPVTFLSITAEKQNSKALVSWKVENEVSINHYEIERSLDGRNFTIVGNTTASQATSYSFMDNQPSKGINFYRIRSVGQDGSTKYSNVAKVNFEQQPLLSIYPNPIPENRMTSLNFEGYTDGNYQLKVFNALGQVMMSKTIRHTGVSSNHQLSFGKRWSQGQYTIEVIGPDMSKTILKVLL